MHIAIVIFYPIMRYLKQHSLHLCHLLIFNSQLAVGIVVLPLGPFDRNNNEILILFHIYLNGLLLQTINK